MSISCSACRRRSTSACAECVVEFVLGREPKEAVVFDIAEFAALRRLQAAGLVPALGTEEGTEGGAELGALTG